VPVVGLEPVAFQVAINTHDSFHGHVNL